MLDPLLLCSKTVPRIWGFGMELGSAAIAGEFLTTFDFPSPAGNLQVKDGGEEFWCSKSVLFKVYPQCKLQR